MAGSPWGSAIFLMGVDMGARALIVGLGNPGLEYTTTRHNVGYMVVEKIAQELGLEFRPGHEKFLLAEGEAAGSPVALLKPLTYMNLSGQAVRAWVAGQGYPPAESDGESGLPFPLLVICDDLNLPVGSVRLRASGRCGGQKGLADVMAVLGTEAVNRLRLGIAPVEGPPDPQEWAEFVLSQFESEELPVVADMIDHAVSASSAWLNHGVEFTASRFNRRSKPLSDDE